MNDLETAKTLLNHKQLTLVIVKNGKTIFETQSRRISGFITAIEQFGQKLESASLADKVAGKAVAFLCVYAGMNSIYAETLSRKAKDILEKNGITHEWKELVDNILDENKTNMCPFEKEAASITDPKEAYNRFKALQEKLKTCR
jgi:hypothetical protein